MGFEIDSSFELWEADTACAFSAGFQSIIGTGIIRELNDPDDKREGLAALMNTLTGRREWSFDKNMVDAVSVFQLTVDTLSCKEHTRQPRFYQIIFIV